MQDLIYIRVCREAEISELSVQTTDSHMVIMFIQRMNIYRFTKIYRHKQKSDWLHLRM